MAKKRVHQINLKDIAAPYVASTTLDTDSISEGIVIQDTLKIRVPLTWMNDST